MADKYLYNDSGSIKEKEATATSAGITDAGKIPALDSSGVFDDSLLPSSLAAIVNGTYTGQTSITTLGTISTGVWNGTAVDGAYINYNTTNLKVTANQLNTIQNIDTTAIPQFGGLGIGMVGSSGVIRVANLTTGGLVKSAATSGELQNADLSGDVVTAGNTTTSISNSAVSTNKLANSAVTYAKIQDVATNKLLGRYSGGSGVVQEISLGSALEFTGGSLNVISTYVGQTSITTVGTISTGVWNGTAINGSYINYNTTNLKVTSTALNTIQDIHTSATPTFSQVSVAADPTSALQVATKQYVDSIAAGLGPKTSCKVATTTALTATYSNGTGGVGATLTNSGTQVALSIDSTVLSVGDRVLVKDQVTLTQNGIFVVTNVGSGSSNWVLTRASDYDNSPVGEVFEGSYTVIDEGTVNGSNLFIMHTAGSITVGTTDIVFGSFNSAANINAGAGLSKVGNTFSVATGGITNAMLAGSIAASKLVGTDIDTVGTLTSGIWHGTKIGLTYGGTNADLSATGGSGQYLKQVSSGAAITVGTIPASDIASGAALSKTDDTNVTLTFTGSPTTALLSSVGLTLGWSGQLAVTRGGTGANSQSGARTNLGLVIGTDVQAYNADLAAIAGLSSTGFAVRTGTNTWAQRSFSDVSNQTIWTNGTGVSGNPSVSLTNGVSLGTYQAVSPQTGGLLIPGISGFGPGWSFVSPAAIVDIYQDYSDTTNPTLHTLGKGLSVDTWSSSTAAGVGLATTGGTNVGSPNSDFLIGSRFTVASTIYITHLGFFADAGRGVFQTGTRTVGIYDGSGTLLASASVSSATSPTNGVRYTALSTAVKLSAGQTYTLIGTSPASQNVFTSGSTITWASPITFVSTVEKSSQSTLAYYTGNDNSYSQGFGPGFLYATTQNALTVNSSLLTIGVPVRLGGNVDAELYNLSNLGDVSVKTTTGSAAGATDFSAVTGTGGVSTAFTTGWRFTPITDINVTKLQVLDAMWASGTRDVGLYITGGALIVSTSVSRSDTLNGKYREKAITPIILTAGTSYDIITVVQPGDTWPTNVSSPTYSNVTYGSSRYNLSQTTLPNTDNTADNAFLNLVCSILAQAVTTNFSVTASSGNTFTLGSLAVGTSATNGALNVAMPVTNSSTSACNIRGPFSPTTAGFSVFAGYRSIFTYSPVADTHASYYTGFFAQPTYISPAATTLGVTADFYSSPQYGSNVGTISSAMGFYFDGGGSNTGTVSAGYGAYINAPAFGTTKCGIYTDSISVGYTAISPGNNNAAIRGQLTIGSSSGATGTNLSILASSATPSNEQGSIQIFGTTTSFPSIPRLCLGINYSGTVMNYGWIQAVDNGRSLSPLVLQGEGAGGGAGVTIGSTTFPGSCLDINGNLTVGASYVGTAAPTNGMIVQGLARFGTTTSPTVTSAITCYNGTARNSNITIVGNSIDNSSDNDGIAIALMHNTSSNRQIAFCDSARMASSATNPTFRIVLVNGGPQMDGIATDASTILPISFGNSGATTSINGSTVKLNNTVNFVCTAVTGHTTLVGQIPIQVNGSTFYINYNS